MEVWALNQACDIHRDVERPRRAFCHIAVVLGTGIIPRADWSLIANFPRRIESRKMLCLQEAKN